MQSLSGDREADGFQVMCTYVSQHKRCPWKLLGRKNTEKIRQSFQRRRGKCHTSLSVTVKTKKKKRKRKPPIRQKLLQHIFKAEWKIPSMRHKLLYEALCLFFFLAFFLSKLLQGPLRIHPEYNRRGLGHKK